MSVSKRSIGATLTSDTAIDPVAALAAALPSASDLSRLGPAFATHSDEVAAREHDAQIAAHHAGSPSPVADWFGIDPRHITHTPITSGHSDLLASHTTPHQDFSDQSASTGTPVAHAGDASAFSGFHSGGQGTLPVLGLNLNTQPVFAHPVLTPSVHSGAHPFVPHTDAGAPPDPELWIAATGGLDENLITHGDDDGTGTGTATNTGSYFTPTSANNPSAADHVDSIDLLQLDTQDNVYIIASQVAATDSAKILIGSLSTALATPAGTPTFTTLFTDSAPTADISGLAVDPDNSEVYFVDTQSFEKVGYAGGTVTNLDTAGVFLDGLALDLPHHVAYFASATGGTTTTTTFVGGTHVHYHTGITSNQIYETSNLTNASSSVSISLLANIPTSDGAIFDGVGMPGLTVDTSTGIIYFTTKTITSVGEGGIWSMTSGGTLTKIYQQTGSGTLVNTGIMNSIVVDHATNEYFVSIINANGTGGGIFVGHLNSTAAPTLWETMPTFGADQPVPDGFSLDNAPTFASVTGAGNYALQGGSQVLTISADGSDADTDNDKGDGAKIVITNPQSGDILEISGAQSGTSGAISWSYNSATHTMTLSGTSSFAAYQALIDTIQFQDTGTDNTTGSHPTRTITYQVYDGLLYSTVTGSDTITQLINRAPTLTSDNYTSQESGSASGTAGTGGTGVLGNDNDKDADSITVTALNGSAGNLNSGTFQGTYGHFDLLSNGSFTYNADNTGAIDSAANGSHPTDSFTYTVSDGLNGTTTTTVTFTINRAPTLTSDSYNVVESNSATGTAGTGGTGVLGNDSDKDGDSLSVTAVNGSGANLASGTFQGTYGHFNLAADGHFTYTADDTSVIDAATVGSHPTDTFTYTVSDGHGGSTTQTVTFTIDRAPTLTADSYNVVESASVSGTSGTAGTGVLGNDSDKDGDSLSVSAVNGSGANVGSGTFQGVYGHFNLASTGSFSYSADNTSAIDGAATGSHLTDAFTYTVSDGHGGSTTQTVTFTLDRAPTVTTQNESVAESGTNTGTGGIAGTGALAGDSDRDGDAVQATKLNGNTINDTLSNFAGTYGHLTIGNDGSYSYVADNTSAIDAAPTGSHPVDTFTVAVDDGHGGVTNETINFTIDRPAIAVADAISTTESSTVTASTVGTGLLGNDSDPDTGTNAGLSVTQVNGSAGNVNTQVNFADGSFITVHADGTYTYDPNHAWDFLPAAASGAPSTGTETFSYMVNGGNTVNVTITINGQDSNDTLQGTAGADTYNGGIGDDIFKMQDGGSDNVNGGVGNDSFYFGASLTGADTVNGGTGSDKISITGDYTGGNALVLTATTLTSVEELDIHTGGSYNITTNDANVGAGQTLKVNAAQLGVGESLTFDGSAETDGSFSFIGGAGNDVLTGGAQADTFNLAFGGADTAHGGGGNDTFILGSTLTAADTIDGGTGADALNLAGEYSGGTALVLGASTITNIGQINFAAGDNYTITTNDGNVGAGQTLTVNGSLLGAGDVLTFNGGAETDGVFHFADGAANDTLTGGAGNDVFNMFKGGNDTVHGGGGNDYFNFAGTFGAGDVVDGGAGTDTLVLNGDYSAGLTLGSTTIQSVEILSLTDGNSYSLTLNGLDVGATATLTLSGQNLTGSNAVTFDGSAVTNGGRFVLNGGAGGDTLIGGGANDTIKAGNGANTLTGGGGQDTMTGGTGVDTYHYAAPGESTGSGHDIITNFDFSQDIFDLSGYFLNAIDTTVTGGILSQANFDHDLQIDIGASQLAAHDAVLFNPSSGYAGHTFLVIDINGTAGYQAGQDIVIDVTGATNVGSFGLSNFTFT